MRPATLSWFVILRLGLVQSALGAIVVLTTSTMNRVMVVELALPAMLPGILVAFHYAVQVLRPRWGYGSDVGGRRTPWIIGGMAVLALGGTLAAVATALMAGNPLGGIVLAVAAFALIGGGVGASGTSLLVLLAKLADGRRRAAAATVVWLMMIAGMMVTAILAGHFLDPFSLTRLVLVAGVVSFGAFVVTLAAVWGVERQAARPPQHEPPERGARPSFREALHQVLAEPKARRFTVFIFVSMLAYSAQDLILEPFAGTVFGMSPGESTKLSGIQHGGVLLGMILVAVIGSTLHARRLGSLRLWTVVGCALSAAALVTIAAGGFAQQGFPLKTAVFALGAANGAFAVAAIGSMMGLVSAGRKSREGTRMGLWGAAQAIAFGLGGFAGTVAIDVTRMFFDAPSLAYGVVFCGEALLFLVAAVLAARITLPERQVVEQKAISLPEGYAAQAAGR